MKRSNTFNNKLGFTLSEVLISLTIMGVIGAILIPSVTSMVPDKNKVMLKKSYAVLEQAIHTLINDDLNYPYAQTYTMSSVLYHRGFNYVDPTTNGSTNKFCYLLSDSLNTVGAVTCPDTNTKPLMSNNSSNNSFTTSDGVLWRISVTAFFGMDSVDKTMPDNATIQFPLNGGYNTRIILDTNGLAGPNCSNDTNANNYYGIPTCSATQSADTFIFGIRYDGGIQIGSDYGADTKLENVLQAPTQEN